jgi:serine protease Do
MINRKIGIILVALFTVLAVTASGAKAQQGKGASLSDFNETLIAVSKKATPAVVNISAIRTAPAVSGNLPMDPHFHFKFKTPPDQPKKHAARGSGVIFNDRGYIVTNNHVVKDTRDIKITLSDKREFSCTIVGTDPATDIAVIKIDKLPKDLPTMKIGDSDKMRVGELVIAIGNPFGFSHTVTMGIISATGRQNVGLADYENYIQTDAAINPGNSGGALVNIKGELIGINTAIYSRGGGSLGIGFAIPSGMVRQVVDELVAGGKVIRGWLGVYIQDVTKEISESFRYSRDTGALVSDVMKGSPAEKSDIKVGDIITKINERDISDVSHLRRLVARMKPGTDAKVSVFRDGKLFDLAMPIGTLPDKMDTEKSIKSESVDEIGVTVKDLNEDLAYRYKISDQSGVVVIKLKANTPAFNAGIIVGDLVREIDRKPVADTKDYRSIMKEGKDRKNLLLLIKRAGVNKFVVVNRE